jgi:hypothetical protein
VIHKALDRHGYKRKFEKSKNFRDSESKVKIEFLLAGDYPGDGKPKAIQFPDPTAVSINRDGIKFLNLLALVELKLASGMTGRGRMRDLGDVQELIRLRELPLDFAAGLSESLRDKYRELWDDLHRPTKRFLKIVRNGSGESEAKSFDELITAMQADGVALDPKSDAAGDSVYLFTTDPEVAKKYGMEDEAEFLDEGSDAGDRS